MSKPALDMNVDFDNIEATEKVHHVGSKERRRNEPKEVRQLNLTSMMDVTFQLLIFFVLTAKFVINEGIIPADLPRGGVTKETIDIPRDPLIIKLRSVGDECIINIAGQQQINGDFEELWARLDRWQIRPGNSSGQFEEDHPIVIRPRQGVRWTHVVDAFNQCIRAKYKNVSFAEAERG